MATSVGPPGSVFEPNPAASAPGSAARLRPSRAWYWVALGIFLVGVAWVVLGFVALIGRVDSFPRVPDPGSGVISLTHSGGYVIYYEGPGASNGNAPPGNIRVTPLSASAAVQSIASHPSSTVYQIGHREGTAVANLQIARPGKFLVRVTSSAAPAGSDLAVGSNIAGGIAATVLPGLLLILSGVGGAIAIAIVRHSRAKRARLPVLLS